MFCISNSVLLIIVELSTQVNRTVYASEKSNDDLDNYTLISISQL